MLGGGASAAFDQWYYGGEAVEDIQCGNRNRPTNRMLRDGLCIAQFFVVLFMHHVIFNGSNTKSSFCKTGTHPVYMLILWSRAVDATRNAIESTVPLLLTVVQVFVLYG